MARKNYKKDEVIKVFYQAVGNKTGLTVQMDVYDETDIKDVGQSTTMTEIGNSGKYVATFTPDAEGDWSIQINDSAGGNAVRHYSVGQYNIQEIGANLQSVENKVDTVDGEVSALDSQLIATDTKVSALDSALAITDAKVDAVDSQLTATDAAVSDVKSAVDAIDISGIDSQLSAIKSEVEGLDSPPMIG